MSDETPVAAEDTVEPAPVVAEDTVEPAPVVAEDTPPPPVANPVSQQAEPFSIEHRSFGRASADTPPTITTIFGA